MLYEHEISIQSNWLFVNSHTLSTTKRGAVAAHRMIVSPEEVTDILISGQKTIHDGIEEFYEQTKQANPKLTIVRPSIYTAHLGAENHTKEILSQKGYDNGGVIEARDEFQPNSQAYFDAIKQAGFRPEARRITGKTQGGLWLFLRRPTPQQVSSDWLGDTYIVPILNHDATKPERLKALADFQDDRIASVDARDDILKSEHASVSERQTVRSRLQISTILASAAFKRIWEIGEPDEDIDDALEYVDNDPTITQDIVLAIENIEPSDT